MSTIHLHRTTSVTAEQYIAALTNFGTGRSKLFGNSADEYLKVHHRDLSEAEVTEGSGGVWERLHYDWSDPLHVVLATTDSNVWGGSSGHTYTFTRRPDGSTDIDVVVVRDGKNLKGWLLSLVLGTIGRGVLERAFTNSVKTVEALTSTSQEFRSHAPAAVDRAREWQPVNRVNSSFRVQNIPDRTRRKTMTTPSTAIANATSANSHELPRTRLSLYYLLGYTLPVGVALMAVPQMTMRLLLTNHAYDDLGLRMFGVLLFSLGILALGLIVNRASSVYTGTLLVRGFIIAALFVLYSQYRDPALLVINLVVAVGFTFTFLSWRKDTAEQRG